MTANQNRPQNVQATSIAAYYAHAGKELQCQRLIKYYLRCAAMNMDTTDLEAAEALRINPSTISARRNDILKTIEKQGVYPLDNKKYRLKQLAPRKSRVQDGRTAMAWTIEEIAAPEQQIEFPFSG
jgi:hypothetical protein